MRILFATPYVPSLVRIRPFNFIKYLSQRHEVRVLALQRDDRGCEASEMLRRYCDYVETVPLSKARSVVNCLRALPTETPLQAAYCYSPRLHRRLVELLAQSSYDLVHIEHLRAAHLIRSVSGVPCVYDSVDCISLLLERVIQNNRSRLRRLVAGTELPRTRRYETATVRSADHVLATSREDVMALAQTAGENTNRFSVVPNGVHLAYPPDSTVERDPNMIVFSGKMSYHANVDAVQYFCREILPAVKATRPEVTLTIVGSQPTREVRSLGNKDGTHVTGYVPDVRPYVLRAAVAVVPIRYAVGIQNKVLEAMAMGTPVVATAVACRALAAKQGEDFLAANSAAEFARHLLRLLDDRGLRERIGSNGRRYVQENHEWGVIAERLSAIYEEVAATGRGQVEMPARGRF